MREAIGAAEAPETCACFFPGMTGRCSSTIHGLPRMSRAWR